MPVNMSDHMAKGIRVANQLTLKSEDYPCNLRVLKGGKGVGRENQEDVSVHVDSNSPRLALKTEKRPGDKECR